MQRAKFIAFVCAAGLSLSLVLAQDSTTSNPQALQESLRDAVSRAKADEAAKKALVDKSAKVAQADRKSVV